MVGICVYGWCGYGRCVSVCVMLGYGNKGWMGSVGDVCIYMHMYMVVWIIYIYIYVCVCFFLNGLWWAYMCMGSVGVWAVRVHMWCWWCVCLHMCVWVYGWCRLCGLCRCRVIYIYINLCDFILFQAYEQGRCRLHMI